MKYKWKKHGKQSFKQKGGLSWLEKLWYMWDDAKERFVRSRRPPKDARLVEALKQVRIRLASTRDRKKLFEFKRACLETEPEIWLDSEFDLEEVRGSLERWNPSEYPNQFVIVAELRQKIIGVLELAIIRCFDDSCPSAHLESLFVLKPFRGYKVATRLLEFAKELAQKKGSKGISLIVGLGNLAALRFYRENGFEIKQRNRACFLEAQRVP